MIDFDSLLTDEEKVAIATLEAGGFLSLAEARISDCRDLNSGRRMRTFRLRGRYDIIIACRNLSERSAFVDETSETDSTDETTSIEKTSATKSTDDGTSGPGSTEAPNPVNEMSRRELLEEAKDYDEITGEYALKKAELAEVVQKARDKRSGNTT